MKKIVFLFLLMLVAGLIYVFVMSSPTNKESTIAYINGEPLSVELLKLKITQNRTFILSHFSNKYKILNTKAFWETRFGEGEVPSEFLKQKALKESIRFMIQQILAKEKGILEDISYEGFLANLKRVNEDRKLAVIEKKIIYGLIEYTETTYFDHLFNQLVISLKAKLAQKEFDLSDEHLRTIYNLKKEMLYKKSGTNNPPEYFSFNEVQSAVRSNCIDSQYDQLIDNLVAVAKIKLNKDLYEKIKIK